MSEVEDKARRRLLKVGVYVPPAILGVMIATRAEAATVRCGRSGFITISAGGNACCPCVKRPNSKKCKKAQCFLGNCAKCSPIWAKKSDCLQQAAACGCSCVKLGRKKWVCR